MLLIPYRLKHLESSVHSYQLNTKYETLSASFCHAHNKRQKAKRNERDKIEFIEKKKSALQRIGMKVIGTK